ncbi:MAG: transposase [Chitinimonas sp.]|nr:transposase [Chitinimonas sp.]
MMDFGPPNFRTTPYGDVDAASLERLREHFDTRSLLAQVDRLDELAPRLKGFHVRSRDEVLRLHRMADTVLNGASLSEPAGDDDIWVVAQNLVDEFREIADVLQQLADALQPLVELQPDLLG